MSLLTPQKLVRRSAWPDSKRQTEPGCNPAFDQQHLWWAPAPPCGPDWSSSSQSRWTDGKQRRLACRLLWNETDFLVHRPMKLAANDQLQLHIVRHTSTHECSSWWKRQHLGYLIFSDTVSRIRLEILWLYLLVCINTDDWVWDWVVFSRSPSLFSVQSTHIHHVSQRAHVCSSTEPRSLVYW